MVERSLKSYDPFLFYVNKISELDPAIAKAHREDDNAERKKLLSKAKGDHDIFICINFHWHAFVLCVPCGCDPVFPDMISNDPFKIPDLQMCWRFDLCYENMELRTYKLGKKFNIFKEFKKSIKETYYIGRYKEVSVNAFQFAALRAAPHHYNHIINDCVEFSKEFCIALLSYSSNGIQLEEEVYSNIRKASATGFSIERLSRRSHMSGLIGNLSLGGIDASSILAATGSAKVVWVVAGVVFFLVYPVVVTLLTLYFVR